MHTINNMGSYRSPDMLCTPGKNHVIYLIPFSILCLMCFSFKKPELFFFAFPKDHVAHHRWLIFFQFGKNSKSDSHDLKKLSVLLKAENIQVSV